MTRKGKNLKRATEIEAMAEAAANPLEKEALLRVAHGLLDQGALDQVHVPAERGLAGREPAGAAPRRVPAAGAERAATRPTRRRARQR